MKKYTMGLCNRHDMPVDRFVFPDSVDPLDTEGLYNTAWDNIPADCDELTVYVSGLTVAMLAVVKVCESRQITLVAQHYDRETGSYYPQEILHYWTCAFCGGRNSVNSGSTCSHCGST